MRTVAAVDLGSNSFHMVIGREARGGLELVDRLREPVRLAAGLDERGLLDAGTIERALGCLERFSQRLRDIPRKHVRAVGTSTVRRSKPGDHFLSKARRALGSPIEVLSGLEEARLIYLGVAHDMASVQGGRLVIDIGGGSTECVIGEGFEPSQTNSLHMGCVNYSLRYFPGGRISKSAFSRAELAARVELEPMTERYSAGNWAESVGCSGTIKAVAEIARLNGWSDERITYDALRQLKKALLGFDSTNRIDLPGVQPDRAPVLPGGVAILRAIFKSLGIEEMVVSQTALREGLLWDLIGRIRHEDVRDRTIQSMSDRYHVDVEHARRVEKAAMDLHRQVAGPWDLEGEEAGDMLSWAARLHEIGRTVAYGGYHRHGQYLLANSNMPGFSRDEQRLLATLVRGHRRKLSAALFDELPPFHRDLALRLCILLRTAVLLHRARSPRPLPEIRTRAREMELALSFPRGWLADQPLTRADLVAERDLLGRLGVSLKFD